MAEPSSKKDGVGDDQPNVLAPAQLSSGSAEKTFHLLIDAVRDYAIFMLDPDGLVVSWNSGAERIKGYPAAEIIGQHFSRFYLPEDAQNGECNRELELARRDGRFEAEGWRVRKDGSRFWANVIISTVRNEQNELVGFAKVTRDLTERRIAEEERIRLAETAAARAEAEHALERLIRLHALTGALAIATTPEDLATIIVQRSTESMGASAAGFSRPVASGASPHGQPPGQPQQLLETIAMSGVSRDVATTYQTFSTELDIPTSVAFRTKKPQWVESAEAYRSRFPNSPRDLPIGPVCALPLILNDHVSAIIAFRFDTPQTFLPVERALMETFAAQAAQALDRAESYVRERTARTIAETAEASLSTTLRSIGDAVIATDDRGLVTMMNPVAEQLTGWTENEARTHPLAEVFEIVNEQTLAPVQSPVEKVLELGTVVGLANHTMLIQKNTKRQIPIDDSGAPIRSGPDRDIEGVVLVFRDVTAKKRDEARRALLEEASDMLSASLDYNSTLTKVAQLAVPKLADWCAVDVLDERSRVSKQLAVAHADDAKVVLARELGQKYSPDPHATTGVPNVLRTGLPELYPEISEEMLRGAAVDAEHLKISLDLHLRSAMVVPLIARGRTFGAMTFIWAESGHTYTQDDLAFAEELGRRCAVAIDNARLFAAEQAARKSADVANRAKDEFLATVSHELRTPLNAILGWAKLLSSTDLDHSKRVRAVETIDRNAVAMAQLIEDLLDISRIISGKMRLEVHSVDLAAIIEAAIESVKPAADAKEIRVHSILDTATGPFTGDPTRLQQIVWNILSNAVKFTPKMGRIDIVMQREDSGIEIVVKDTGKGIAPRFLPHVFELFRQEDAHGTKSRGGLGLGLAITRQLVELHGGRVEVQSDGEGCGATFIVRLPTMAVAFAPERQTGRTRRFSFDSKFERPAQLRGLRVLVVDDEEDARQLVRVVLEECGCNVSCAANVEEALAELAKNPPDILISDIGMPGQDGYDLIRQVRAQANGIGIPAAALTAYARAEDRRRVLNAGYSMHIAKPVEPSELVAIVVSLTRFVQRERPEPV